MRIKTCRCCILYDFSLTNQSLSASFIYLKCSHTHCTESFYLRRIILESSLSSITLVLREATSVTAEDIQIFQGIIDQYSWPPVLFGLALSTCHGKGLLVSNMWAAFHFPVQVSVMVDVRSKDHLRARNCNIQGAVVNGIPHQKYIWVSYTQHEKILTWCINDPHINNFAASFC